MSSRTSSRPRTSSRTPPLVNTILFSLCLVPILIWTKNSLIFRQRPFFGLHILLDRKPTHFAGKTFFFGLHLFLLRKKAPPQNPAPGATTKSGPWCHHKIPPRVQWRIQKILVGGDLKHKTSKIRVSSPKLRVIFRPKSEIQTFFSPKFRWSPKKKKKKKKKVFTKIETDFSPDSLRLGRWGGCIPNWSRIIRNRG